ncbi:helix-turn-helix domain-containing protein [Streptomyces sp. NPDC059271]|uniref:helix-turn-helix domain-containing protein n=1 Tax=Streptomyces sp. NPDC059271 TaxID=3346799 RepID=UPI0036B74C2E
MDEQTASTTEAVGPRLKGLRTQRTLSLTSLAEATGISLSTLSRLESGQRRTTLELLLPLARELRGDIGELIGAPQTGDPRLHLKPVHLSLLGRQGERAHLRARTARPAETPQSP